MTLIENALKKLQGQSAQPVVKRASRRPAAEPGVRKKVSVDGPKHHVDQRALETNGLLAPSGRSSLVGDEFRRIKRPLIANALRNDGGAVRHGNVIMITSPLPGAGKTFCSMNLAVSMSLERDINVLLVDADVAKPHITRELGLVQSLGLIDLLAEEGVGVADVLVRTDLNELQVLPAGKSHRQATELLASERMLRLVDELSMRYPDRLVLLDSPPLLVTSEAQVIASIAGQVVMIVEAGKTSQQELTRAIELVGTDKAVNLVLNKSHAWGWLGGDYAGGDYGYGYGYGHAPD
jgi:receptor protein-tyrosine kinase